MTPILSACDNSGHTDCTQALQHAIDAGPVSLPAGIYTVTNLQLRSGTRLHLEAGAEIRARHEREAYLNRALYSWERCP